MHGPDAEGAHRPVWRMGPLPLLCLELVPELFHLGLGEG
jgi:hypothetical protein